MAQTISLDPRTWAKVRIMAFERSTSASKLVAQAVDEFLARELGKPQGQLATEPDPIAKFMEARLDEVSVISDVKLYETSIVKDPLPGREFKLSQPVPIEGMPWDEAKTKVESGQAAILQGNAVTAQDALPPPAVIKDPKEVGAAIKAVAPGREFHPVPKPASTRKPRR
jgi:hypothetical protein